MVMWEMLQCVYLSKQENEGNMLPFELKMGEDRTLLLYVDACKNLYIDTQKNIHLFAMGCRTRVGGGRKDGRKFSEYILSLLIFQPIEYIIYSNN